MNFWKKYKRSVGIPRDEPKTLAQENEFDVSNIENKNRQRSLRKHHHPHCGNPQCFSRISGDGRDRNENQYGKFAPIPFEPEAAEKVIAVDDVMVWS